MIYKKIARIVCLFLVVVLMIGVCGCMEKTPKFSVDDIVNYMTDKYGVEFNYLEPVDNNQPTASSLAVFLETSDYPGERIFAKCVVSANTGEKTFSDNYTSYLYEEDTRSLLTTLTKSVYPDAKIRYAISLTAPSSYSSDSKPTFEEYISRTKSSISYTILLADDHDTSVSKEESEQLCSLLKDNKVACSITIAYAQDDLQFNSFNTNNWKNANKRFKLRGDLRIGDSFDVEFEEWR